MFDFNININDDGVVSVSLGHDFRYNITLVTTEFASAIVASVAIDYHLVKGSEVYWSQGMTTYPQHIRK